MHMPPGSVLQMRLWFLFMQPTGLSKRLYTHKRYLIHFTLFQLSPLVNVDDKCTNEISHFVVMNNRWLDEQKKLAKVSPESPV